MRKESLENQSIPKYVQEKMEKLLDLLRTHGMWYEDIIAQKWSQQYDFIFPKSPYYQLYISKLSQLRVSHQPESQVSPGPLTFEGTIEDISVGAMAQIVKEQKSQGHPSYQPFEPAVFTHTVTINTEDKHLATKISHLTDKYQHLHRSKRLPEQAKIKTQERHYDMRKELGTNPDGSLGVYGGKKYEGLGKHDEFSQFRKEQSQQYFSTLQEKHRQI